MNLHDQLEVLHQQYYQSILNLQDKQDIIDALPSIEYASFFNIISGLINLINIDIHKMNNLLVHENNIEMKEYIQEELDSLLFKKEICEQRIKQADELQTSEKLAQVVHKRNIIFAKTSSNNIYIQEDLKNIAEEYYNDIHNCLIDLENTKDLKSIEKQFSNHAKLSKTHELRPFKIRVCYKVLAPDLVYVMIAKYKKSDNDRIEREKVIERIKQTNNEFNLLKKEIKNPVKKQQIIEENQIIRQNIIEYLDVHKRGI